MNSKNYDEVRAAAQRQANELGNDVGLEFNALFKTYNTFLLPKAAHRQGHELRCEVVRPEFVPIYCEHDSDIPCASLGCGEGNS